VWRKSSGWGPPLRPSTLTCTSEAVRAPLEEHRSTIGIGLAAGSTLVSLFHRYRVIAGRPGRRGRRAVRGGGVQPAGMIAAVDSRQPSARGRSVMAVAGRGRRDDGARGWRARAEWRHGRLAPDRSPTLTASEIGAFAFFPQAWYLERCRLPVSAEARERRRTGRQAHRAIGHRTDLVRAADAARPLLLTAIAVLLALLGVLASGALR
jgi:hypothetical protein